ncbi:hypothetical protein AAFN86_08415 [Roseomonas sp. CAU 1739]|uniref:hypothetical protein n=1 Tax=Roseomonas sp. CAU 1739 TaxID=3140364 RepID=UPI00325AC258
MIERGRAIALVLPDGRCLLRSVTPESLAATRSAVARSVEDSGALMRRVAADAAAARFALAREKVPAFSDWAFDWVQSYINSFRMLGAMLRGVADSAAGGDLVEGDALVQRMAGPMRQAFHQRVLAPSGLAEGLAADAAHAASLLELFWARGLADAVRPIIEARAAPPGPAAPRLDLAVAVRGLAAELAPLGGSATGGGGAEPGSDPTSVFVHSMRPMAARLSAVALRASEAGSLLAAGGAVGFAVGGAPGLVLGTAGGVGLYWTIDWGLNRVDAALNRSDFEAKALQAIDRAEAASIQALEAAARAALLARQPAIDPRITGCPPAAGGR